MKPALETTRLRLRPCRIEDVEKAHTLWTHERVRRFLFDDRVVSLDEARSFVAGSLANFEQKGYGLWLVFTRDTNCLAGFAGLLRSEGERRSIHVEGIAVGNILVLLGALEGFAEFLFEDALAVFE